MRLVEIWANEIKGHGNYTIDPPIPVPDGWAVIPEDMVCENFPFGDLTAEEIDDVMTVTSWTPGEVPEPEPIEEPYIPETADYDTLAAALTEGVDNI